MSLNVLLIDDEAVDLEWLRRRVEGSPLDLRVAGTANSGFAGLKLMEQVPVDIILSDIRMPIMSGTEFARKAKEIQPNVKVVFISGHEDFHYAREAIEMGAFGYLLKPVADEELNAMLESLHRKVMQERESDRSFLEALSLVNEELLLRWLNEPNPGPIESHIRRVLDPLLTGGTVAAVAEIDDLEWKMRDRSEEERRAFLSEAALTIQNFTRDHKAGGFFLRSQNRFVILASVPETRFLQLMEELLEEVRRTLPLTVTIGVGTFARDMRQLHDSYRQAQAALSAKWLLGKNRIIRDASERQGGGSLPSSLDETVERMLTAILEYDLVTIDDCLLELFERDMRVSYKNDVYELIIRLTSKLHAELQRMNENLYELVSWESHKPEVLFHFETVHDIVSWLRRRLFELSELLYSKKQRQKRKLIEEIIRHVEERLEQKVTLKEVAAFFDFTPNYLGHLFHEETGMHFSDFLQERRMEHVCRLLCDPTLRIYEIAERAGYKNIIYFNRQFKLHTGMTPGEYRKKNKI